MNMVAAFLQFPNGKKLPIEKESVTVGRSEPADLIVDDQSISRAHATLAWEDDAWTVQDLGSRNGTFVDNKQLEPKQKVTLTEGCTVHFGYVQMKFYLAKDVADDATMALDMNDPNVAAMFAAKRPEPAARPAGGQQKAVELRSSRKTYAQLELRSVTNPKKYDIDAEVITIGTDAKQVDIAIIDSNASPVHAEIRFLKGQRIQIKNLAENFGTLVNGRRVGKAFIKDGDQIDAGDSSFTFRFLEWPESSLVKDDKALAKAKMAIFALLGVIVIGGGIGVYKLGFLDSYVERDTKPGTSARITMNSPGAEKVLDLVTQSRYDEARSELVTLSRDANISDELKAEIPGMQRELDQLRTAKDQLDTRDFIQAYLTSRKIDFDNSQLASRAMPLQREIQRRYREAIQKLQSDITEAENAQNWDLALRHVGRLQQIEDEIGEPVFENSNARLRTDRNRIQARRQIATALTDGNRNIRENPRTVLEDSQRALDRVEESAKQDEALAGQLAGPIRLLRSQIAHAQFLIDYFEYDGRDVSAMRAARDRVDTAYAGRDDINRRYGLAEELGRIYVQYQAALADVSDSKGVAVVQAYDKAIGLLEQIVARENDTRFTLSQKASEDIRRLRDERKRLLLSAFTTPVEGDFPAGLRGDLERTLAERKKWFDYLSLYELGVRENRYRNLVLVDQLRDEEVANRMVEAYDRYDRARSDLLRLLLRNYQERVDEGIRTDTPNYFVRLRELTLPEDKETERAIASMRTQME